MKVKINKIALAVATLCVMGGVNAQTVESSFLGLNHTDNYTITKKATKMEDLLSNRIEKTGEEAKKAQVSDMRKAALTEVATNLGATNGLQFRMEEKQKEVNGNAASLDEMFPFSTLTIDNGVMAPVLEEGQGNYSQHSPDEITVSDKKYRIVAPAKFVSVYPDWRQYLLFKYPAQELPPSSFLPQNDGEKAVWDAAVKVGWDRGVRQAEEIYQASYNRLVRDFKGMRLYKILLAEGLITPTLVAGQNLGVTGGGKEMDVNKQVFRITDHSALNPNSSDWKVEYPVTNNVNGLLK